jgi:tetratricopeptide (TPR) repeat protein/DNA-binding winged helix-turn-helix (wHTH) protein
MDKKESSITVSQWKSWKFGPRDNPGKYLLREEEGLYRAGESRQLGRTALRVLTLLVRNAGRKLSKDRIADDLSDEKWKNDPARFASEYVRQVRDAFDPEDRKEAIKTERSIGYQFVWNASSAEDIIEQAPAIAVATPGAIESSSRDIPRTFVSKLPSVNSTLFGRQNELILLDQAWSDGRTNFVQIIAAGGTGKTALVDKWFRPQVNKTTIFGWSFYSQGVSENRQTSSEPFFNDILSFLHIELPENASIFTRAERIAERLRNEKILLILDGLEPLQESTGDLRDTSLKALLQELATANDGMVLCTTRLRVKDIPDDMPRTQSLELENLPQQEGGEYLRHLGVLGEWHELLHTSADFGNHALALTLLGHYLTLFCEGWVRRRSEIPALLVDEVEHGPHARRVMRAYARMLEGKPELEFLFALGFFDRPIEPKILRLVLPSSMDEIKYAVALSQLRIARLVYDSDPAGLIDCHPLIREHFAGELSRLRPIAYKSGHSLIYGYYSEKSLPLPTSLDEMMPLFYAVYHGTRSGQRKEVLDDVYRRRILRGNNYYLSVRLGRYPTNISLLANFFELPWSRPAPDLSPQDQAWLFFQAGFSLRAVGRFTDAIRPFEAAARAAEQDNDWAKTAAIYGSLQGLHIAIGNIEESLESGRSAVVFADRSGDRFQQMSKRTCVAEALHMAGDFAEAEELLNEAEQIAAEGALGNAARSGTIVYVHCNLLLDLGRWDEILRRATETLKDAEARGDIRDAGLMHAMLGMASPSGSKAAVFHLDQAVELLRAAGSRTHLGYGLLARKKLRDLEELYIMATSSGMRLNLADYHLAMAQSLLQGDFLKGREHLRVARSLLAETGYHRRDSELTRLEHELG